MGKRRKTEKGATLVEAGIVTPIIFMFILAIVDGGLYLGERATIKNATSVAARAAATAGADSLADYDALRGVKKSIAGVGESKIERIVIYRAANYDEGPMTTCMNGAPYPGGGIGSCNVYSISDTTRVSSDFGPGAWAADDYWPGWSRNNHLNAPGSDYVGVWVRAKCYCVTKIFGSENDKVEQFTVVRIEARQP